MRLLGLFALLAVLLGTGLGLLARSVIVQRPQARPEIPAAAYDRLDPGRTKASQLAGLGFDPADAERLSDLALMEIFLRGDSADFDALDPQVKDCFLRRMRCAGYGFPLAGVPGARAILVVADGRLAYKMLTGQRAQVTAAAGTLPVHR
jgi:hypothetical protein